MLYLIVPVHNRATTTAKFLNVLVRQKHVEFTLLLVDDGCTDDTVAIVQQKVPSPRLRVLKGDGNLWWAGSLDLAYRHLRECDLHRNDAVMIINDDVTFDEDFLWRGMEALRKHPGACLQAIGVDRTSGSVDQGAIADLVRLHFRAAEADERPNCLSTRGLLMDAATFLHSGGFRSRWLPHYLSDYEFTMRLRRRGVLLAVDKAFCLQVDLELTGTSQPSCESVRRFWTDSFSNRAKFNPKHWSAFVLMACPLWVAPLHLMRIWLGFTRSLLAILLGIGRSRP